MTCKCGHSAVAHFPIGATCQELVIPCMICDCKDYDRAPKEVGF